ncbi:MAG TPA: hypothetical protein VLA33_00530 [Gemmatimonadota bacterium]|nr:hypothetical protein [Gemmatimonadota bacterium]
MRHRRARTARRRVVPGLTLALALVAAEGCATLQQFAALRQVQFAIDGVGTGRLAGIDLARVRSAGDLRVTDAARLAAAMADEELPLEFTLDVRAENPAENQTTARMVRFAWTLLLDDRETIDGVLDREISLPPGDPQIIPLTMRLDLIEFFDGNATDLLNLALRFAGADAETAEVKLRALPTVETPLGPIEYPATITIVGDD